MTADAQDSTGPSTETTGPSSSASTPGALTGTGPSSLNADWWALAKTPVRFQLLAGRFRGCDGEHGLSIVECQAFEAETREALVRLRREWNRMSEAVTTERARILDIVNDVLRHNTAAREAIARVVATDTVTTLLPDHDKA